MNGYWNALTKSWIQNSRVSSSWISPTTPLSLQRERVHTLTLGEMTEDPVHQPRWQTAPLLPQDQQHNVVPPHSIATVSGQVQEDLKWRQLRQRLTGDNSETHRGDNSDRDSKGRQLRQRLTGEKTQTETHRGDNSDRDSQGRKLR